MERTRIIAAAPVRSAVDAWRVVTTLIAETLERSLAVKKGSVTSELAALRGLGPALIAGGHLESNGLVLVDEGLHLTIHVLTADGALAVEENLNPVPGGAGATDGWVLYLPSSPFDQSMAAAVKSSPHLSMEDAPSTAPAVKSHGVGRSPIDLDALRSLGNKP